MPGIDLLPELEGNKYYHPKKWTQRHRMCVALSMAGWTNNEICKEMGWTPAKVSVTLNDPRADHERENALQPIADVNLSITQRLEEASSDAFEKAMEILHGAEKEETALKAAFGILDRAGYTPIKRELRLEGEVPHDPEVLEAMKQTLKESKNIRATYRINPAKGEAQAVEGEAESTVEEADYEIVQGQSQSFVENVASE